LTLIDLGMGAEGDPGEALETLFVKAHGSGIVTDGLVARSEAQRREFWTMRESIPAANSRIGAISSHDISLPLSAIPEFIARGEAMIAAIGDFQINCFGHLGDGNLHYNVFAATTRADAESLEKKNAIRHAVYDLVTAMDGSISAEHGIGRLKVKDLERYGNQVKLEAMRAIKDALDPLGIMNPGAVLPLPDRVSHERDTPENSWKKG